MKWRISKRAGGKGVRMDSAVGGIRPGSLNFFNAFCGSSGGWADFTPESDHLTPGVNRRSYVAMERSAEGRGLRGRRATRR